MIKFISLFKGLTLLLKVVIILSLIVFVSSLTQPAFDDRYVTLNLSGNSLSIFLVGWAGMFGGGGIFAGIAASLIWTANPLYFISVFLIVKGRKYSIIITLLAAILAYSFTFFDTLITGIDNLKPDFLELGYYLWFASFLILLVGTATFKLLPPRTPNLKTFNPKYSP